MFVNPGPSAASGDAGDRFGTFAGLGTRRRRRSRSSATSGQRAGSRHRRQAGGALSSMLARRRSGLGRRSSPSGYSLRMPGGFLAQMVTGPAAWSTPAFLIPAAAAAAVFTSTRRRSHRHRHRARLLVKGAALVADPDRAWCWLDGAADVSLYGRRDATDPGGPDNDRHLEPGSLFRALVVPASPSPPMWSAAYFVRMVGWPAWLWPSVLARQDRRSVRSIGRPRLRGGWSGARSASAGPA